MHPPNACQVALKRVSILFNFTKTHSNLPDIRKSYKNIRCVIGPKKQVVKFRASVPLTTINLETFQRISVTKVTCMNNFTF